MAGQSCFCLEDVLIAGGLLLTQCIAAGYIVFVGHLLALGADPLALIVVAGAASSVFFLPFAVALERKKWPSKISQTLVIQLALIALGGITMFQELMLLGIKKTTPAIASAMPNLCPGMIFIMAACFRLEKFNKACRYTQAKILGTVVCLVGAMALSFLQNPSSSWPAYSYSEDDHLRAFITTAIGETTTEPKQRLLRLDPGLLVPLARGGRLRPVHCPAGCDTGQLPCAIDDVHCNLCIGCRLHRHPASGSGGKAPHGLSKNRHRAYRRNRLTRRAVGWILHCASDMVPEQEGAAVRVSVWARPDCLLRHPLRCSSRKNCNLSKHGRDGAHVQWSLHSPVGQEQGEAPPLGRRMC